MKKLSKNEVIERFIKIHGEFYDYSNVSYVNSKTKVDIICPNHGSFKQTPNHHWYGHGCPYCRSDKMSLNTSNFIEKSLKIHGNKYNYEKTKYKSWEEEVIISCKIHGDFKQRVSNHLYGYEGCEKCVKCKLKTPKIRVGWGCSTWEACAKKSKNFDSYKTYIIKCKSDGEEFFKVGRTFCKIKKRFRKGIPYKIETIKIFTFKSAREAFNKELELKKINSIPNNKHIPQKSFSGETECFKNIFYD